MGEGALQGDGESAGHFALSLATGLDVLPFDEQIAFLEAAFVEHWAKIQDLVSHAPLLLSIGSIRRCSAMAVRPIRSRVRASSARAATTTTFVESASRKKSTSTV